LAARPEAQRRRVARARAEEFGWPAAVAGFLRVHDAPAGRGTPAEVDRRTA
ncbi:glycosyltransferase family 1 protein, partial [Micromonospora sp. STR1s_6]|nr:glycosyltransferase family 1 protein [Micromonospora tarensis]